MASVIFTPGELDDTEREGMLEARRSRVVAIEELVVDGGEFCDTPIFVT
jgi:hypothetical protein